MTPDKQILASYLPTSAVSATFVNERAARLFANEWFKRNFDQVKINGCTVVAPLAENTIAGSRFLRAASWYNAAAEHAAEIAEGK